MHVFLFFKEEEEDRAGRTTTVGRRRGEEEPVVCLLVDRISSMDKCACVRVRADLRYGVGNVVSRSVGRVCAVRPRGGRAVAVRLIWTRSQTQTHTRHYDWVTPTK
jgi:hypothetical protein